MKLANTDRDGELPARKNGVTDLQLIHYGSDGVNPNLRVYVELSNEVWNSFGSAFRQYFDANETMKVDARTALGTPSGSNLVDPLARPTDFAILNFDNLSTAKDGNRNLASVGTWRKRKIILRAVQVSDIFRSVWGDGSMWSHVRPLYEWQYADSNFTASAPLKFIYDYFNNGDGDNLRARRDSRSMVRGDRRLE